MIKIIVITVLAIFMLSTFSLFISAEDTSNIAAGKSYTYEGKNPIDSNGGDPDKTKLTDGVIGEEASLWNVNWICFESKENNTDLSITVDLGQSYNITKIALNFLMDSVSGASYPVSFKIFIGENTNNMTEVASESYEWLAETSIKPYSKTLASAVAGRYVKLSFTGNNYTWNTYMGIDELMVYDGEASADTSEPTVSDESKATDNPKTGDFNIPLLIIVAFTACAGSFVAIRKK